MVNVVDPPAWVSNMIGLTRWHGGIYSGIESAIAYVPELIGLPVLGALIVWILYASVASRSGSFLGTAMALLGCIAFQFTIAQAYLHLAERERKAGDTQGEAAALAKVHYIFERSGSVFTLRDATSAFNFFARLGELQAYPEVRSMFPPPLPVHIRLAQISITLESDLQPVPVPIAFTRGTRTMESYRQTLSEAVHKLSSVADLPFDISGLEHLGFCDLRLPVGMNLMPVLLAAGILPKGYEDGSRHFFEASADLIVQIHSSANELPSSFQGLVHSYSKLPNGTLLLAYYDRHGRVLHLAVDDADWRRYNISMLRTFADTGKATYESQKDFIGFVGRAWLVPMTHESWHFILQNMPSFNGLPVALEEGMASFAESLEESLTQAVQQNARLFDQLPGLRNSERERSVMSKVSKCPQTFRDYWNRLVSAQERRGLIPVDRLLQMDSQTIAQQSDVSLVYAEGWALTLRVWFSPQLFGELLAALARRSNAAGWISPEDRPFWDYLDHELLSFAAEQCGPQSAGGF